MSVRYPRTTVAALLTTLTIGLPCTAWWIAGRQSVEREAAEIRQQPFAQAELEAERLSLELAAYLEDLTRKETRRPYHDYLPADVRSSPDCVLDPTAAAFSTTRIDPLIWTHFRIDDVGQITLPDFAAVSAQDRRAVFDELECTATQRLATLRASVSELGTELLQTPGGVVRVGPFNWHEAAVSGRAALVALREVRTRPTVWRQGFIVRGEALDAWLRDRHPGARAATRAAAGLGLAPLPLGGVAWSVAIDPGAAVIRADEAAEAIARQSTRVFLVVTLGAIAMGVAIVGVVHQSERLALRQSRFAAAAAHELRTPLAGMQLYAEMLGDGRGDPQRSADYAQRIAADAARMGRVVGNVLGFARFERSGPRLDPSPGDLGAAVREIAERLRPSIETAGARLELTVDDGVPIVAFDRDALDSIVGNLVDNAERYNRNADDRTVRVRLSRSADGGARLSVEDRGNGIDARLRRRLFQPFVRGTDPDAPAGLGIGLALVADLCRAQRARVRHDPSPRGGTRFSVEWPRG